MEEAGSIYYMMPGAAAPDAGKAEDSPGIRR